jgi:D-beta-D-heptose 7-phosphate kinase/D-beta-D-heptose 1-phosphate adenosyltransferase
MNATHLLSLLAVPTSPRVLVLGDMMLDVYTTGQAERISPEAPVVVLRARDQKALLGGAANVCQMLRGLQTDVSAAGVVGADETGQHVQRLLDHAGVNRDLVYVEQMRPTTRKERFLGASASRTPSQILRVDHETREPISTAIEDDLVRGLCKKIAHHDALLISDYGKGVCTPRFVQASIRAAQHAGVPVLVDPLPGGNYAPYSGATMLKPNRAEAESATGISIRCPSDALRAGKQLCEKLHLHYVAITLDREGIAFVDRHGFEQIFPTTTRTVCDITGAGDMVLAVLGYCLACKIAVPAAIELANVAASLEIQRVGVAVISKDEIRQELLSRRGEASHKIVTIEQATQLAELHHQRGEKIVFTNGCFDLLHVGHLAVLSAAAAHGDILFVAANSDDSVRRLKGNGRPIIKQADRAAMLAALGCVGYVVLFDEDTPHRLLHAIKPDVLVKGGTYTPDQVVGHEVVLGYGGEVCVTGVIDNVSTTNILQSAIDRTDGPTGRIGKKSRQHAA